MKMNMKEINLNEMEMVVGGWNWAAAIVGGVSGAFAGAVAGAYALGPVGAVIGGIAGGAVGGLICGNADKASDKGYCSMP